MTDEERAAFGAKPARMIDLMLMTTGLAATLSSNITAAEALADGRTEDAKAAIAAANDTLRDVAGFMKDWGVIAGLTDVER